MVGRICYHSKDNISFLTETMKGVLYVGNSDVILRIKELYELRTREEIVKNLNVAVQLGKSKGLEVDRYRALPEVTGKSKHTTMSWFNRPEKKIPLIDLCVIAKYFRYNIFTFFTTGKEITKETFLIANDYNNLHYPADSADVYIRAYNLHKITNKDTVIDNVESFYGTSSEILEHHSTDRQKRVMSVCDCTLTTYRAWFNRSRARVKIPLFSLCLIANDIGKDLFWFFEKHNQTE